MHDLLAAGHDVEMTDLRAIQTRLAQWSREYCDLPLYAAICAGSSADDDVAALLRTARPGQARPVLLLAALHDLVLDHPDLPIARWYRSVHPEGALPSGDPWPDARAALLEHADRMREVIATHSTQTNEVNRCVYLAALLQRACADIPDQNVGLVEIGASAGLLLGIDKYHTTLVGSGGGHTSYGPAASAVQCVGDDRSAAPFAAITLPPILDRRGLDLAPVDLRDTAAVRWLAACLWPEVPGRYERFTAAVDLMRVHPPVVDSGDMIDDLPDTLGRVRGEHLVLFSSWALTYTDSARRPLIVDHLAEVARDGRAVSWISAEPPRCVPGIPLPDRLRDAPGGTILGAHQWRDGVELPPQCWGTAHPHGQWIAFD